MDIFVFSSYILTVLISDIVSVFVDVLVTKFVHESRYTNLFTITFISIWLWKKKNLQPYKLWCTLFPALAPIVTFSVLYLFFIFMLPALKVTVKIKESNIISCFHIKYFILHKRAVQNLKNKKLRYMVRNLSIKDNVVDWPFIFHLQ